MVILFSNLSSKPFERLLVLLPQGQRTVRKPRAGREEEGGRPIQRLVHCSYAVEGQWEYQEQNVFLLGYSSVLLQLFQITLPLEVLLEVFATCVISRGLSKLIKK